MSISATSDANPNRRSNLVLWLILVLCLLPIVGSTLLYFFWKPERFTNYGELVPPVPLGEAAVTEINGRVFRISEMRGKWIFLAVDRSSCDRHCRDKLYYMRQIRLAQGKDMDRIERVWIVADGRSPAAEVQAELEGTRAVLLEGDDFLRSVPGGDKQSDYIYLIDPLGNLMMRYPRDLDPTRMKKDIARLLRISGGWRQTKD